MEKLINNFLDYVRLDLHLITPLPSAVQVEEACQEAMSQIQPLADAKGITLQTEFPPDPLVLQADPLLLQRALANLLENAIKYSPPESLVILEVRGLGDRSPVFGTRPGPRYCARKTRPTCLNCSIGA